LRLGLEAAACGECLVDPPPFRHTVCAVDYDFPWAQLLQAFKFEGQVDLVGPLAALLEEALRRTNSPRPALVLPVPLAPQRLRERGYNQAWELARRVARSLRLPARADLLQRPLQAAPQAELSRAERQRNLRAAFWVPPEATALIAGRELALVDDVMTTGATAREAAAALHRAGAAAVDIWVLARTPTPER
jgi:ComF family protein